jgi:hypothetical protein
MRADTIQGRRASRLPLAFIFRAFGAAIYMHLVDSWEWYEFG